MPYTTFRQTRFYGSLDGLRFLSVAAVVWHHTASRSFDAAIFHYGMHGVTLFFAISGFLITTLLLREKERFGTVSLRKFYIRRSLRIFPLYYTVVLLYVVAVKVFEGDSQVGLQFFVNLKYYLTYTSNWFVDLDGRVIFYFAWSLATEEQYYLVWPSVERHLKGWKPVWAAVGMIALAQLAVTGALASILPFEFGLRVIGSISTAICMGVILAHLLHEEQSFVVIHRLLGRKASALIALIFLVAVFFGLEYMGLAGSLLLNFGLVLLVGSCVIREDNILAKGLRLKPIAWIGTVSYGVYLLHMLCANAAKKALPEFIVEYPIGYFVLALAMSSVAATISFKYYESFFLKLKKRFETKEAN